MNVFTGEIVMIGEMIHLHLKGIHAEMPYERARMCDSR